MGNKISADKTEIGVWFTGKPIYAYEQASLEKSIEQGKFVAFSSDAAPEDYQMWFKIRTGPKVGVYYKKAKGVTLFWSRRKRAISNILSVKAGVSVAVAMSIADAAIPPLIELGKEAAKAKLRQELDPKSARYADLIVDELAKALGDAVVNASPSNVVGSGEGYVDANPVAYGSYEGEYEGAGDVEGGCGCKYGAFYGSGEESGVAEYVNSGNTKARVMIIEEILKAASDLGLKVTGTEQKDKIKSLLESIPSGDRIKVGDAVQGELCKKIATAINNAHGSKVIDQSLPGHLICQQIAEVIGSLSSGMHLEFLAVSNDVRRALRNLAVLKSALEEDFDLIKGRIADSGDAKLSASVTELNDLHKMLLDEIGRQSVMLAGLLNVELLPSEKDLKSLISSKKDIHSYIDKIDVKLGSRGFGKVVSDILRGLGMTANFALVIDNALKKVGMTLDEYKSTDNYKTLRDKIMGGLIGKTLSTEELHEYLEAADLLYKNLHRGHAIKSGSREVPRIGGADEPEEHIGTVDVRVKDRLRLRNLIFSTFYKGINDLYDRLVVAMSSFINQLGADIPITEELVSLRNSFVRLNGDEGMIRNKKVYFALLGYFRDAVSVSLKDRMIGDLKLIVSTLDFLGGMSVYASSKPHFDAIRSVISDMLTMIDKFSDELSLKVGRGEETEIEGGYESIGDYIPELRYSVPYKLVDVILEFDYRVRAAQIKRNLANAATEFDQYGKDYNERVTASIADHLLTQKEIYETLRKALSSDPSFSDAASCVAPGSADYATKEMIEAERDAALKFLELRWQARKNFWSTVESVDIYMRQYAESVTKNPNLIKNIRSLIDSVPMIQDWYSDATGNMICNMFDQFPVHSKIKDSVVNSGGGDLVADNSVTYPQEVYTAEIGNKHYYKIINRQAATSVRLAANQLGNPAVPNGEVRKWRAIHAGVGNPSIVTSCKRGMAAYEALRKAMNSLAALKNLFSVFSYIGNGTEAKMSGTTIISPARMYENILDYICVSAFEQGYDVGKIDDPKKHPNKFNMIEADASSLGVISHAGGTGNLYFGLSSDETITQVDDRAEVDSNQLGVFMKMVKKPLADTTKLLASGVVPFVGDGYTETNAASQGLSWPPNALAGHKWAIMFRKRWGIWMRSALPPLQQKECDGGSFKLEDEYFAMLMKALASKVLVSVGLIDLFEHPLENNKISGIRMILGGSGEIPNVTEEATPLYIRLPLLAEFYREVFGFNDKGSYKDHPELRTKDKHAKISFVPDIDGVFGGLIDLVFRKEKNITKKQYSDEDFALLVTEINSICAKYTSKGVVSLVDSVVQDFVNEINRRYGIVTARERNAYVEEFGFRYDYSNIVSARGTAPTYPYGTPPALEYAILPGENSELVSQDSPAVQVINDFKPEKARKGLHNITLDHKDLIRRFRCALDKAMETADSGQRTLTHAIKRTQASLKSEQDHTNRFKLVVSLLREIGVEMFQDRSKVLLFHETVVTGLNTLSAIHSVLSQFSRRVHCLDLEGLLLSFAEYYSNPANIAAPVTLSRATIIRGMMNNMLVGGLIEADDAQIGTYLDRLFSRNEQEFGGNSGVVAAAMVVNGRLLNRAGVFNITSPEVIIDKFTPATIAAAVANSPESKINDVLPGPGASTYFTNSAVAAKGAATATNHCLLDLLQGYSVMSLLNTLKDKNAQAPINQTKKVIDTIRLYLFDHANVMRELTDLLWSVSNDTNGLVKLTVGDTGIFIDWSKMKDMIAEQFANVKYYLDMLGPQLPPGLVDKYIVKESPGSYYWLQEQIVEKLIVGRPARDSEVPKDQRGSYVSLDDLTVKINDIFDRLTREWSVDGDNLNDNAAGGGVICTTHDFAGGSYRIAYGQTFNRLVSHDAFDAESGYFSSKGGRVEGAVQPNAGVSIPSLKVADINDPIESLYVNVDGKTRQVDTRYVARWKDLYTWDGEITQNKSLLQSFNQLIAKYVSTGYDPTMKRMYSGLVTPFMTGVMNHMIMDNSAKNTYPDIAPCWFIKGSRVMRYPISEANTAKWAMLIRSLQQKGITIDDNLLQFLERPVAAFLAAHGAGAGAANPYDYANTAVVANLEVKAAAAPPVDTVMDGIFFEVVKHAVAHWYAGLYNAMIEDARSSGLDADAIDAAYNLGNNGYRFVLNLFIPLVLGRTMAGYSRNYRDPLNAANVQAAVVVSERFYAPQVGWNSRNADACGTPPHFILNFRSIRELMAGNTVANHNSAALGESADVDAILAALNITTPVANRVDPLGITTNGARVIQTQRRYSRAAVPQYTPMDRISMMVRLFGIGITDNLVFRSIGNDSTFAENVSIGSLMSPIRIVSMTAGGLGAGGGGGGGAVGAYIAPVPGVSMPADPAQPNAEAAALLDRHSPAAGDLLKIDIAVHGDAAVARTVVLYDDVHTVGATYRAVVTAGTAGYASLRALVISQANNRDFQHAIRIIEGPSVFKVAVTRTPAAVARNAAVADWTVAAASREPGWIASYALSKILGAGAFNARLLAVTTPTATVLEALALAALFSYNMRLAPPMQDNIQLIADTAIKGNDNFATTIEMSEKLAPPQKAYLITDEEYRSADKGDITRITDIITDEGKINVATTDPISYKNILYLDANNIGSMGSPLPAAPVGLDLALLGYGPRGLPTENTILYSSLAAILRNIITSRSVANTPLYVVDSVSDIAPHSREALRANLPTLKNMLAQLHSKCEHIRKLLNLSKVNCRIVYTDNIAMINATGIGVANIKTPWPFNLGPYADADSTVEKNRHAKIIDAIANATHALIVACEQTLQQIGDDPKGFETYQNSIKDYKAQYGVSPLMPLSHLLYTIAPTALAPSSTWTPVHKLGTNEFKVHYGLRGLFGNLTVKPTEDLCRGFFDIENEYANVADARFVHKKETSEKFLNTTIALLRYVHEMRRIKSVHNGLSPQPLNTRANTAKAPENILGVYGTINDTQIVYEDNFNAVTKYNGGGANTTSVHARDGAVPHAVVQYATMIITNRSPISVFYDVATGVSYPGGNVGAWHNGAFATGADASKLVRVVENMMRTDAIDLLLEKFKQRSTVLNSSVANIYDLGIVPINVHALMRDIPLANIYNYSYSFDRMIVSTLLGDGARANEVIRKLCDNDARDSFFQPKTPLDAMAAFLIDPYRDERINDRLTIDAVSSTSFIQSLAQNPMIDGMGRAKFLSDQLFSKSLLGNFANITSINPVAARKYEDGLDDSLESLALELLYYIWGNDNNMIAVGWDVPASLSARFGNDVPGKGVWGPFAKSEDDDQVYGKIGYRSIRSLIKKVYEGDLTYNTANTLLSLLTADTNVRYNAAAGAGDYPEIVKVVNWMDENIPAKDTTYGDKIATYVGYGAGGIRSTTLPNATWNDGHNNNTAYSVLTAAETGPTMTMYGYARLAFGKLIYMTRLMKRAVAVLNGAPQTTAEKRAALMVLMKAFTDSGMVIAANPVGTVYGIATLDGGGPGNVLRGNIRATLDAGIDNAVGAGNVRTAAKLVTADIHGTNIAGGGMSDALIAAAPTTISLIQRLYSEQQASRRSTRAFLDRFTTSNRTTKTTPSPFYLSFIQQAPAKKADPYDPDSFTLTSRTIDDEIAPILSVASYFRTNTKLIRNLVFIVNLLRALKYRFYKESLNSNSAILKSDPIAKPGLTDFFGVDVRISKPRDNVTVI